jgi:hypothetical protein
MAQQKIVWTALPNGRITEGPLAGRWRVSLVASPRLLPEAAGEQQLGAFPALRRWPETVMQLDFGLQIGNDSFALEPEALPDMETWARLFADETPVAGFAFKDMAGVNLRSFAVRNVLGFARRHYGLLAASAGADHPVLLPWQKESPLGGLLGELGTRVTMDPRNRRLVTLQPGFERFHPRYVPEEGVVSPSSVDIDTDGDVFNDASCIVGPQVPVSPNPDGQSATFRVRALPPDWESPDQAMAGANGARRAALMARFGSADEYTFYQADRFYRRHTPTAAEVRQRRPDFANPAPELKVPEFDFHRILASYGDYPALLRALGLVIDCLLPEGLSLDAAPDAPAAPLAGRMLPLVKGQDPALKHACLQTAWEANARRFVAAPRTRDHRAGLLALQHANDLHFNRSHSEFDVYQVDPDGTALKTVNYLLTAQNLIGKSLKPGADGEVTYTTGDAQPVAALRSAGLGVSRHGRAGVVAIDAQAAALKNAAIEQSVAAAARVVLFAEDVLRGYRVDVQTASTGRWRSLCERSGQYRVLRDGGELAAVDDEGYVKSASTTSKGGDDHYLHESLFRWAGWSLVAPRPGRSLVAEHDSGLQTERATVPGEDASVPAVADSGNGLQVSFSARKASLPRLRFGELYRFRARLVDLAGNSLQKDDRDIGPDEQASDPVPYTRFEPVDPPVLVLKERLSEGESLERLVIRSNFDAPADSYLQGAQVSAFYKPPPGGTALPDFAYTPVNQRHVVPPKAAQALCEHHGCFDTAMGSGDAQAIKKAYALGARESGSLLDAVPGAQVELVTPQSRQGIATVDAPGELIAPPDQADLARDRFAAGQYVIHREDQVAIPYLPDPGAGGMALHGVPGLARLLKGAAVTLLAPGLAGVVLEPGVRAARVAIGSPELRDPDAPDENYRWVLLIDFDTDPQPGDKGWPDDRQSLRIALHDQPAEVDSPACDVAHTPADPPKWDAGDRTLHLFLPQGRIARLRYASFVHDLYLGHLGLPQWVNPPAAADQVRTEALSGANWMLTPFRRLVLVHATQQPVCKPVLAAAWPDRPAGATYADLIGGHPNIALHGPSTGKFEVLAQWQEWVDDPARDDPARPGPRRITCEGALGEIRLADNHANRFTIEQAVQAQRAFEAGAGQTTPSQLAQRASAPGNRHEFGDTRFRRVRYHLRAVTRFREYLPPDLYAQPELVIREGDPLDQSRLRVVTQAGLDIDGDPGAPLLPDGAEAQAPLGLVIPASAAPDAPRIVYTLPTFRWSRAAGAAQGQQTSTRDGNALRVYLDRPWFSSGDGELLAVVVAPKGRAGAATPFSGISTAQSDRVTQWGLDPLWESVNPGNSAEAAHFPLRVADGIAMLPDDGGQVGVVAHRVYWSPERQLWYCDIEISTGRSYMPFVRLALARYQPNALTAAQLSPVVLADFAQLLPRRRAVLQRTAGRVSVSLHGPVPTRGPMRDKLREGLPTESPYADISFRPIPGEAVEMGENRIELLLQTRDAALDSDLAWRDGPVLASGPAVASSGLVVNPRNLFVAEAGGITEAATGAVEVALRSGRNVRFDRAELQVPDAVGGLVSGRTNLEVESRLPGGLASLLDPVIWEKSAAVPDTGDAPARLVLREFERYYTDRSVPEQRAGVTRRRRVVEERLVYTEFFAL